MHVLRSGIALLALMLAGCNAATSTQPASPTSAPDAITQDSTPPAADRGNVPATGPAQNNVAPEQPQRPVNPIQSGFDQLSGRLTLLQEQVLQLRTDSQRLLEQNQMLLNRMQLLGTAPGSEDEVSADDTAVMAAGEGGASEQLDAAIGQLMQMLNQMELPAGEGGQFGVATTYTRQGSWVLLRFDRRSGETWLADGGRWKAIRDVRYLNRSAYRVLVHRADQDAKGYVAVRMDEQSGMSWWLNGDQWQEYEQ